jgi:hypothetical protein
VWGNFAGSLGQSLTSLALWLDVLEPTTVLLHNSQAQVPAPSDERRSECCPVWSRIYDYLERVIGLGILSTLDPLHHASAAGLV